ncbi:uncharacterized protein LY79DRAFT_674700 [Colletotrichum navitas]|uniref:Cytochrome P450 n=1 Tax=Colletotrichum navitas TaxID=681940 RepID=A0AAD8PKZ0_9PEZI|nr:uncharacterized protein LY79DRAFT_674700 [Colletotrichum navitas]KAK1569395.1 hypothetical protein LY79DRAFT_674700 [Colletotrichum navitas]
MSLRAKLSPAAQIFNDFKQFCDDQLASVNEEKAALGSKGGGLLSGRPTIFRHLLNSDLPQSELDDDRLSKEARVLIGAGTITTAGTMCFITYYVMAKPHIKKRLEEELASIMADYLRRQPT